MFWNRYGYEVTKVELEIRTEHDAEYDLMQSFRCVAGQEVGWLSITRFMGGQAKLNLVFA